MRIYLVLVLIVLLSACSNFKPQALDYSTVEPHNKKRAMDYAVYTPPNWQEGERLPLIVFLHGGGGSHLSFERYGAHQYLDAQINAGRIARAVIVLPDGGNGFWENWADGTRHYRDWVLNEVVPKVRRDYQTLNCPDHCHLAGISMGGFGALRFAYFARDQFSSVSAISAPIFNRNEAETQKSSLLLRLLFPFKRIFGETYTEEFKRSNPYNAWVNDSEQRQMRLQLIWGDQDSRRIISTNQTFHQRLVDNNVKHDYYVFEGRHKWKYWVPNLGRVINFLVDGSE